MGREGPKGALLYAPCSKIYIIELGRKLYLFMLSIILEGLSCVVDGSCSR